MSDHLSAAQPEDAGRVDPVDLIVVGAGILGLAHASLALTQGQSVIVLDRDHEAVGASVRNFGHACVTAQSGDLHAIAKASRRHWLAMAERAGFWAAEAGAVVIARTRAELDVLDELSAAREDGEVALLDADETARRVGRPHADGILGGAWLRDDLRVDPRTTVAALAAWIDTQPRGEVRWNTTVFGAGEADPAGGADPTDGADREDRADRAGGADLADDARVVVRTSRGPLRARRAVVCVGHDVDRLWPELAAEHRIQRCALQMARVAPLEATEIAPAVLTATSMLRYPAFTDLPSAQALREQVQAARPELIDIGANVMCTQRPDGSLLIGDSHAYSLTAAPFLDERTSQILLDEHRAALGRDLAVIERWQGIYASSDVAPYLVREVAPGVTVVSVTSGVGMTLSFGLAERTLAA
ncbi:TIGR03364 family FAD-dependent oxidoreductase [Sinomonas sp. P10A9]|uniref:TIGR03364 family FAD-dependent oxidoreductase n=1 Tax=Sinomonas puerhi TaxID=3238584 RepID=A0AB39L1T1_9MICC